MSTTQSSVFAAQLHERLAPFGVEGQAAAWLAKALHPAGVGSAPLMPDSTYVEAVRPEYRAQAIVSAPSTLTTASWDLAVVRIPGDNAPVFWIAGNAGTDFGVSVGLAQGQISLSDWDYAPDGNLDNLFPTGPVLPAGRLLPGDLRVSWRTSYASLTCYMTASALNDQGTVFSGQIARVPNYLTSPYFDTTHTSPSGSPLLYQRATLLLPTNEDQILLMSPKAYTAPARDGVYIPYRLNGPTQPFVTPPEGPTGIWQAAGANYAMGVRGPAITGLSQWGAVVDGITSFQIDGPATAAKQYNWGFDNTACSVTLFRGLSPAASITLKYYTGLELEVYATSVVRQFTVVPSGYSPRCLEAYYRICQEMPSCYPSSFNSLGTLMGVVGSAISKIWPTVSAIARGVVMAPVAARAVREIVRSDLSAPQVVVTPASGRLVRSRSVASVSRARSKTPARSAVGKKKKRKSR